MGPCGWPHKRWCMNLVYGRSATQRDGEGPTELVYVQGICTVNLLDRVPHQPFLGWVGDPWSMDVVYGRMRRWWPQMQLQTTRPFRCGFEFKPEEVTTLPMRTALFVGHCPCWKGISKGYWINNLTFSH